MKIVCLVGLLLTGCASVTVQDAVRSTQNFTQQQTGVAPIWLITDDQRAMARNEVDRLLQRELGVDDALRIALAYSPAFQLLLSENVAAAAQTVQDTRLPNPVFTFERLFRREHGGTDLDIGRMLSVSLLDLLFLPARLDIAEARAEHVKSKAAADIVHSVMETRQAWIRAVAAYQSLRYFEQVKMAAEASAELARRMQAVGNYSKLQRTREQAFYAEATAQLARAKHHAYATREALVRNLGLPTDQAANLKLPERLPELPQATISEESLTQRAFEERLDIKMAKAELLTLARSEGLVTVTRYLDGLHLAGIRNSETGKAVQKGYEIEVPLPLFDFGDARREGAQARYYAALNRAAQVAITAQSQVRENYHAYRTAFDLAAHYRDEIVPLRKIIAEEMLLQYNGMLIGVFELLADAREQIGSVILAIDAQRDFWLTEAALLATLLGKPTLSITMQGQTMSNTTKKDAH